MRNNKIINSTTEDFLSSYKKTFTNFQRIPTNNQGFVILRLSKKYRKLFLRNLKDSEVVNLVSYLDPDDTVDILQNLDKRRRNIILTKLSSDIRDKVEFLLKFNPDTAAGMMSVDYIEVEQGINFEQLSKIIKRHEKRTGRFPTILIVEQGFLIGEILAHSLAIVSRREKIDNYVKSVPHINHNSNEREVIEKFKKYPHNKIIVLDDKKSILGVIYSDDVLQIIEKHSTNHLRNFAGINDEEDILDSALTKVKYRYKWLIINLLTAFLAAFVIGLFEDTISAFILLAIYMPVVAGMGGNAGTQTLAVTVRGIALKEIDIKTSRRIIMNEVIAGAINGLINGLLVAGVAILWNKNPMFGLVIGLAMIINLIIAGFFGAIVPLIMVKFGKDPASSATIFITTATDVFGFLVFLGLASILLPLV